ncbi:hypothetical protein ACK3TF_000828 [Chlorella vulgaris]
MIEILYRAIWRQAQLAQPCENQDAAGTVIHSHFATPTSPSSPGTLGKHEKRRAVPDRGRNPVLARSGRRRRLRRAQGRHPFGRWNLLCRLLPVLEGQACGHPCHNLRQRLGFQPRNQAIGIVGAVGLTDCNCNIYTGDKRQACRVCQARRKVYNYPMPGNPSKYVACTTQGAFPQPCNTGLKWNQKLQDCTR